MGAFNGENPFGDRKGGLRFGDLIKLSLRVFKTKPLRTILTILGMSIGIGAVLFLVSLGFGLQFLLIGNLVTTEDSLITMEAFYPPELGLNIESQDLLTINGIAETGEVSPVAEFPAEIGTASSSALIIAKIVEPSFFRLSGTEPALGEAFEGGQARIVLSDQALRILGIEQDESALSQIINPTILYQREGTTNVTESKVREPLRLSGIVEDEFQPPFAIIPREYMEIAPPFYTKALVKAEDINVVERLRDKLLEAGFLISARIDLVNQAQQVLRVVTIILGAFGITALIVSAIGMFNTMIIGFLERTFEVGIIKSIGGTQRDIKKIFLTEAFVMGLAGGAGGVFLGMSLGFIANTALNILAKRLGGDPIVLFVTPWWFVAFIIGLSSLIGLIAGYWPARRASLLSPKEAFLRK